MDKVARVFSNCRRLCNDQCNRLTDVTHASVRKHGMMRLTHLLAVLAGEVDHIGQRLESGRARIVVNERYAQTNSLYSFLAARAAVGRELVVLNSDVLFHPLIAQMVARYPGAALAYDSASGDDPEQMKVEVHRGRLVTMAKTLEADRTSGENVGIIRLSGAATRAAFDAAAQIVGAGGERSWLPAAIAAIASEHPVACLDVAGLPWVEIDFPEDLAHARARVLPVLTGALASAA